MLKVLSIILLSGIMFSDDHIIPKSFEECEGRIANYYVAKLTKRGSVEGWYKATEMHKAYYQSRGAKVNIYPSLQYRVDEENNTENKVFRVSNLVVWDNQEAWQEFRDFRDGRSKMQAQEDQKEYDAFVAMYDRHNEVTAERRICLLD